MSKADLRVDWATHEAAKYACEKWHYSRCIPKSKLAKFGVWEDGKYIGAVIYGVGATADLVKRYGLEAIQGCELVRVALTSHKTTVSRIVAITLKLLKVKFPGLRLVVSFADPAQGHHGGIYQGGGWVYAGMTDAGDEYLVKGIRMHGRALRSTRATHKLKTIPAKNIMDWARKVIDPNIQLITGSSKHRYLMPLDAEMRARIAPLAKPYPKRPKQAEAGPPEMRQCDTDPDAPICSAEWRA